MNINNLLFQKYNSFADLKALSGCFIISKPLLQIIAILKKNQYINVPVKRPNNTG